MQMTSFDGNTLTDHVRNVRFRQNYLPIFPVLPTDDHPDVQLKLEHGRVMRKDGYVNLMPKAVPIEILETSKSGPFSRHNIGYLRMDKESINTLREKSGFRSLGGDTDSNSEAKASLERVAPEPTVQVTIEETACVEGDAGQLRPRDGEVENIEDAILESASSRSRDEQAMCVRQPCWPLRVLSDLVKFMYVDPMSDIDTSSCTVLHSSSTTGSGQDDRWCPANHVEYSTSIGLQRNATIVQALRRILSSPSLSFHDAGCGVPGALFNQLVSDASKSSSLPQRSPPVLVQLTLYHATIHLPYTFDPFRIRPAARRIAITKARSVLSIGLLKKGRVIGKENEIEECCEVRPKAARSTGCERFLLFHSREGIHGESSMVILAAKTWKELHSGMGTTGRVLDGSLLRRRKCFLDKDTRRLFCESFTADPETIGSNNKSSIKSLEFLLIMGKTGSDALVRIKSHLLEE